MVDITGIRGETLEVDYSITNSGDFGSVEDVELLIDGNVEYVDQDVMITDSAAGTLYWQADSIGTYTATVSIAGVSDQITVQVGYILDRIDYFEGENLNNYEGDLGAFSITSNSLSGQYSLLMNSDPFAEILSLSGLNNYPVKGDIVRYIARSDEGNGNIGAVIGADSGGHVSGEINVRDGELQLRERIGSNSAQTVSVSLSANQTYEGVLEWHDGSGSEPEDTFVFTVYEWDGSRGAEVGGLSRQVSAASGNSGVGFIGFGTGTVSMRLDQFGIVGSV